MNIREISKPMTAKSLNESLAKRFGTRINIGAFTLEQLQDARNRLRTKISQVETNESFGSVLKNESYQKSKLFLDVLNAAISEREDVAEAKDDADAKKIADEKRKKEEKKKKIAKIVDEDSRIVEGAEDHAELVMAAKDMVDRLTGWMEDTAEMQTESMLDLADAVRDEMGQEQSDAFVNSVKPALESLYAAMETTRVALTQGVGQLTGEAEPADTMGADVGDEGPLPDMGEPGEDEMEPTMGDEDEFATAAPAAGGDAEAGRARRESIQFSRKLGTILSSKKK
jgi:prophage DNA circulation protein